MAKSYIDPNGAVEKSNIGCLTRRVPASQVVCAVPERNRRVKPPKRPKTPRVVGLLRKAIEWQAILDSGRASNQAEIARREGLTRARVTQVMGMLRLVPEIQQHILSMPDMLPRPAITERALRPIVQLEDRKKQIKGFHALIR